MMLFLSTLKTGKVGPNFFPLDNFFLVYILLPLESFEIHNIVLSLLINLEIYSKKIMNYIDFIFWLKIAVN